MPVHRETVGANFTVEENEYRDAGDGADFVYQFFTKTEGAPVGRAHDDNHHLVTGATSADADGVLAHVCAGTDHPWYPSLQPDGTDRTRIRYGAALAPEVMAATDDVDALIAEEGISRQGSG